MITKKIVVTPEHIVAIARVKIEEYCGIINQHRAGYPGINGQENEDKRVQWQDILRRGGQGLTMNMREAIIEEVFSGQYDHIVGASLDYSLQEPLIQEC